MQVAYEEGDKARIITDSDTELNMFNKFKARCCRDCYSAIPIILSVISLFLALGTIFGVAVRWSQIQHELQELRALHNNNQQPAAAKRVGVPPPPSAAVNLGVTYIRWGQKVCAGDASLVYAGYGAGSSSGSKRLTGGGAEYLCLPPNPEWNKYDLKNDSLAFSWIYAAEYLSYKGYGIFADNIHGHNMPCSVCLAPRSTKIMIPAKRTCPRSWTKEYEGYLMTSYVTDSKMSFECVDENPQTIAGTHNVTGGAQMFFVSSYCGEYGGVSGCPPYINARELTCVVCSK